MREYLWILCQHRVLGALAIMPVLPTPQLERVALQGMLSYRTGRLSLVECRHEYKPSIMVRAVQLSAGWKLPAPRSAGSQSRGSDFRTCPAT